MFTEDKTGYKEFNRGEAFYELGDPNSGEGQAFSGIWDETISYWKNKLTPEAKPTMPNTVNLDSSPIAMASSHTTGAQVVQAVAKPTAVQTAPSIVADGSAELTNGAPMDYSTPLMIGGGLLVAYMLYSMLSKPTQTV